MNCRLESLNKLFSVMLLLSLGIASAENPPPRFPVCVTDNASCTSGNLAHNGTCEILGAYCVDPDGGCKNSAGDYPDVKDAKCLLPALANEPCRLSDGSDGLATLPCSQHCTQSVPLLSVDCRCAYDGGFQQDGMMKNFHVKTCIKQ
jgi:hypothetical protein